MSDASHDRTTRAAYDATVDFFTEAIGTEIDDAIEAPVDRALLAAFAASVRDDRPATVADLGCGPGRAAAFLHRHGIATVGVDMSLEMLRASSRAHPHIGVSQGRLRQLPLRTESLCGVVSWYSIIHTPPDLLGPCFGEMQRVLEPHGQALIAFQAGAGEAMHRSEVSGTRVDLTSYRHSPDTVIEQLDSAGLTLRSQTLRQSELAHESTPQAFVLARRR